MSGKKGFLEIEFIISSMVFLSVLVFIMLSISREMPSLEEAAAINSIRANGYVISQLLLLDKGEPQNWGGAGIEVKRIGLSSGEPYVLDMNKINKLENLCKSDFQRIKDMFNGNEVNITIRYMENCPADCTPVKSCGPSIEKTTTVKFVMSRFAVTNDKKILNVTVTVYGVV